MSILIESLLDIVKSTNICLNDFISTLNPDCEKSKAVRGTIEKEIHENYLSIEYYQKLLKEGTNND